MNHSTPSAKSGKDLSLSSEELYKRQQSLGFYIWSLKKGFSEYEPIPRQQCLDRAGDFREFLRQFEQEIMQGAKFAKQPICPVDELNFTSEEYIAVVEQIYRNIDKNALLFPINGASEDTCFSRYIRNLGSDTITETAVNRIMSRINSLLEKQTDGEKRLSGLVVGRVQSGKTRNYIGLMLKAVSERWNVILVLTSNNVALCNQTRERIRDEFNKAEVCNGIEINFVNSQLPTAANVRGSSFFWGTEIKQVDHLDGIIKWFQQNAEFRSDMRVLIIDDEADNATPETGGFNQLWTAEQIEEKIATISEQNDYIGNWLDQIASIELNEDDENILQSVIDQGGSAVNQKKRILADQDLERILSLDDELRNEIDVFFSLGKNANTITSPASFVKLIRSIFEIGNTQSAINSRIRQLLDRGEESAEQEFHFKECVYLGYTATPYACIFNRCPGETPLFPDFIYSLEKSPEHFGLQEIFGSRTDVPEPNMNIITILGDTDQLICENLQNARFTDEATSQADVNPNGETPLLSINCRTLEFTFKSEGKTQTAVWQSLKEAIAWAFCTAAARRLYHRTTTPDKGSRNDCWTTMILNLSQRQDFHARLQKLIKTYLSFRCSPEHREGFREECRAVWEAQTGKFTADNFRSLFHRDVTPYPEWDDLQPHLNYFFNARHYQVIQINSSPEGKSGQEQYTDKQPGESKKQEEARRRENETLWIICGGNTIARGLTLSGLTVSYFDRVRNVTAVDSFTQMGRWFGYRSGYELLPRIWMPLESVIEFKRAALCEEKMHEDLEEAFSSGLSPADGENYMIFYCWHRKLSLRAFAIRPLTDDIAMAASTNWIFANEDAGKLLRKIDEFLSEQERLGRRLDNRNSKFPDHPVWSNLPADDVRQFLHELINFYPEQSRRILRGLVAEIEKKPLAWDVVSGSSITNRGENGYPLWGEHRVTVGTPRGRWYADSALAKYNGARSHVALFAMFDKALLNEIDCAYLEAARGYILSNLRGLAPDSTAYRVLPPGDTLEERFDRLIADLKHDFSVDMPETVHGWLKGNSKLDGYRNRSSHEYQIEVYHKAKHDRPTLQIYLIQPPEESGLRIPLVSLSFFWPDHQPDQFFEIAVGLPKSPRQLTTHDLWQAIRLELENRNFPCSVQSLREAIVQGRLAGQCSVAFFCQNVKSGTAEEKFKYRRYPGKDAYYALSWAASEQEALKKVDETIFGKACEILRDQEVAMSAHDLFDRVKKFFQESGVMPPTLTEFNKLFTPERCGENFITITHPKHVKTYQFIPQEKEL